MPFDPKLRILVVDNFANIRKIMRGILKQLGLVNVQEAEDAEAAWELMDKHSFDLVISDWNMPGMSGLEFLQRVRGSEKHAELPFVLVTAEAAQDKIVEAAKAKVSNYVVKPFTAATLEDKLSQIFERQAP